jgi:hypothetical protein
MFRIITDNKRPIKKNLFALRWGNTVPGSELFGIVVIPFKPGTLKQIIIHDLKSIYQSYTIVKAKGETILIWRHGPFRQLP